jgi:hypothetical protein
MKLFKLAIISVFAAAALAVGTAKPVSATSTPECKFEYANFGGKYGLGQGFDVHPDVVSTQFKITGDEDCRMDVTLTVWKIPHATLQPYPVEEQEYFSHATGKDLKPGFHTLASKVPACFWQADLVRGTAPTGPGGKLPYEDGRMLNAKLGGDKQCVEEPEDVCPNIDGTQSEVPEGHELNGKGDCVVPEEPEEPGGRGNDEPEVKGEQTPTILPETGAGALAGTFMGISASAGIAHAIVSRFRR